MERYNYKTLNREYHPPRQSSRLGEFSRKDSATKIIKASKTFSGLEFLAFAVFGIDSLKIRQGVY